MNYVVLLNNEIQMKGNFPIIANLIKGKWQFHKTLSKGQTVDITKEFEEGLKGMFRESSSHFLKPFTVRRLYHEYFKYDSNEILRVLNIKSEIYEIQVQLHQNYTNTGRRLMLMDRDRGEQIDVTSFFEGDQERFLITSVFDFVNLINYVEYTRNALMLSNTFNMGIAFTVEGHRWMNLVSLKMSSVDNPFTWLYPRLGYSKVVHMLEGRPREVLLDEPQIFATAERGGHITYYTATPKDILTLLNIHLEEKLDITSAFAVQLMGVCFLKALGFRVESDVLPTTTPFYIITDENGATVDQSFRREDLVGDVWERSMLRSMLPVGLGYSRGDDKGENEAMRVLPEFERMRLT